MNDEKLGNLVCKFFETFNCGVSWKGGILNIENVPKDFEKFFGKTSPYAFSFDPELKGGELITKNSYLIKIINDYMDDKAQTTFLKIDFNQNLEEEIAKHYSLKNCKIASITKKESIGFFIRFTFLTTIQYLNEKKQITTSIYLSKNEVKEIDDSNIEFIDGLEKDIKKIIGLDENLESNYSVAKEKIKELLKPSVLEITDSLKKKLDLEITRINDHSNQQLSEINGEINRLNERIALLKKDYEKKGNETIPEKIKRLEEKISEIKDKTDFEKLNTDKELLIKNEIRNHGLSIKNKIINTSIIYYPIFNMTVFFKTARSGKIIAVNYDPFVKEFSELKCESCDKKVEEIIVCSSGHLTCRECGKFCESCGEVICKKCKGIVCAECKLVVCPKCYARCSKCGKDKCLSHFSNSPGEKICKNCMIKCFSCGEEFSDKFIRKDKFGRSICHKCYAKSVGQDILRDLHG